MDLLGPAGDRGQEASEISPEEVTDAAADLIPSPIGVRPPKGLAQVLRGFDHSQVVVIRYDFNDPHPQDPVRVMNSIKKQIAHDDCLSTMSRALNPLGRDRSSAGSPLVSK